jgi:outer membrane protein TolC
MSVAVSQAQTYNGGIRGSITDPHGAAIAGAAITLTDEATHQIRTTATDSAGAYAFNALKPSTYTLHIGAATFSAAERTMAEANALIGVETAAYYPTITIGGDLGLESTKIGNLFTWPSRFFSAGPSASERLFDGGLRRGLIAQYKAQYEADAAAYRQTVLTAFQQTEDYLASVRWLGEQRQEQQNSIAAAQRYYDLSIIRYKTGVDTYLNVFTAQTSLLSNQQIAITLQVQQMTSSVQLIEALGGGWDTSQLPSEKVVARK